MLMDLVLAAWLLVLTGYLVRERFRTTAAVKRRRTRIERLKATHAGSEALLARLHSLDRDERLGAAKEVIAQRAARRRQ